jgi:sulfatase maturation enzyme AslB (radical SAM superfamily)
MTGYKCPECFAYPLTCKDRITKQWVIRCPGCKREMTAETLDEVMCAWGACDSVKLSVEFFAGEPVLSQ